ncbi:MAG: hypothetical protein JW737_08430 [Acidobacteria bacterium]|nr:hypothetical protein [Acidobacteriota bacterium]
MIKYRFIITVVLSVALILYVGFFRPFSLRGGMAFDNYWANKILWNNQFDILAAGDSLVIRGISPAAMQEYIPGLRIGNYAFSGIAFDWRYLDAVERVIDKNAKTRVIILGVTAKTLTRESARRNRFRSVFKKLVNHPDMMRNKLYHKLVEFFREYEESEIMNMLTLSHKGTYSVYHPDGWLEGIREETEIDRTVTLYETIFKRGKVSYKMFNQLLGRVKKWVDQGIIVIIYHPPVHAKIYHLETMLGDFRKDYIARKVKGVGAYWMDFNRDNYSFYDGIHMRSKSAVKFSKEIAQYIRKILDDRTKKES